MDSLHKSHRQKIAALNAQLGPMSRLTHMNQPPPSLRAMSNNNNNSNSNTRLPNLKDKVNGGANSLLFAQLLEREMEQLAADCDNL